MGGFEDVLYIRRVLPIPYRSLACSKIKAIISILHLYLICFILCINRITNINVKIRNHSILSPSSTTLSLKIILKVIFVFVVLKIILKEQSRVETQIELLFTYGNCDKVGYDWTCIASQVSRT